jgi:hypothetical protein
MARLAFLVAIVALVFSWAAYRRSGGELKQVWSDATGGTADFRIGRIGDDADQQADLARARAKLLGHRTEVAADRNLDQVRRDVAEVRASLERSFANAGAVTKDRWRGLDDDLGRLEGQLKDGGSKALATLDSALEKIRRQTGEDGKDERR